MSENSRVSSPSAFIAGTACWNSIVILDRLPEPGKALSLAALLDGLL